MSAFVERWHKETSSFHLPVGEVTITLDDVEQKSVLLLMNASPSPEATLAYQLSATDRGVDGISTILEVFFLIYVIFNFVDTFFIWHIYLLTLTFG